MAVSRQPNENKVAHAMATHGRMATQEWRHTIRLKQFFKEKSTHEWIDFLCRHVVQGIDAAIRNEKARSDQKDGCERNAFIEQLEEVRERFEETIGAAEGESVEDRQDAFNCALDDLYEVGDMKIELRDGRFQKFMWIA